jgi:DNA invertase Pin-like site-specific DNA recombinase
MKVFSYIRVSTAKQEDGDGPVRQHDAVVNFCNTHRLFLMQEYSEAISGTIDGLDRPQFAAMVERIERSRENDAEPVVGFVVESMNRLARTLMVSEYILLVCKEKGIKVFTCENGTLQDAAEDSGDPSRVLVRQIMGAVAEFMKSELVKKMAGARERVRKETGRCEGRKPYGYRPGEQTVLNLMESLVALGWKPARIAQALNNDGHKNRSGGAWTKANVWSILSKQKDKQ